MFKLNYGFLFSIKSEARDGMTDGRTDGLGATVTFFLFTILHEYVYRLETVMKKFPSVLKIRKKYIIIFAPLTSVP